MLRGVPDPLLGFSEVSEEAGMLSKGRLEVEEEARSPRAVVYLFRGGGAAAWPDGEEGVEVAERRGEVERGTARVGVWRMLVEGEVDRGVRVEDEEVKDWVEAG